MRRDQEKPKQMDTLLYEFYIQFKIEEMWTNWSFFEGLLCVTIISRLVAIPARQPQSARMTDEYTKYAIYTLLKICLQWRDQTTSEISHFYIYCAFNFFRNEQCELELFLGLLHITV